MKKFLSNFAKILLCAVMAGAILGAGACNKETEEEFVAVAGTEGLVYSLNEDGESYTFNNLGTCTDPNVVIGNWYNNLPVTGVAEGACRDDEGAGNVEVQSITVSMGIVDFGFRSLQNWNVRKIILANGIESFGRAMFRLNTNMEVLVIGTGLQTITSDAFSGLTDGQTTIYFRGTEAQWNSITVEEGNDALSTFTVVYNYSGDGSEL